MQNTERILQAMHNMGVKRTPLMRVYRSLYSEDLYLAAYAKISKNAGAMTPGPEGETADGMSIEVVQSVIEKMRYERFRFRPSRGKGIPKKSGGVRQLGMPDFTDKLVQEALRLMLDAYYEPRFRDSSHGYRPGRACHTALKQIKQSFRGAVWFIEGDIKGCFDNLDHDVLMSILARDIHDGRLLNLIHQGLKAGKLEEWEYKKTYSGTPQGGILSPLLSNIYLHELDCYVEDVLIPQYTRGQRRGVNPDYKRYEYLLRKAREAGDEELVKQLEQERRQLPSVDPNDPNFRRLKYVRYADDFLLAFIGPKKEAEAIRDALSRFLKDNLNLEMSTEKTLITHAKTEKARFLGYDISIYHVNDKLSEHPHMHTKRRSINSHVRLGVPYGLAHEYGKRYMRNGKTVSQFGLLMYSDANIIDVFQSRFQGLANYYRYAVDRCRLGSLKNIMQQALVKTLAHKYKISVSKVYRKYRGTRTIGETTYKTLQVDVPTKKGTRTIFWGAVPLTTEKVINQPLIDTRVNRWVGTTHSDLIQRLQANECEICGSTDRCQVHHIRKLSDLKQRWRGKKRKPVWVKRMIMMQRKTLVVCHDCHTRIHAGQPVNYVEQK
jgi:group II intron reverse transcriptase/maturase